MKTLLPQIISMLLGVGALNIFASAAALADTKTSGFLDFNLYPYTEEKADNHVTINALVNLDNGFQYFSFTNFGRDSTATSRYESNDYLTEQNIRWTIPRTGNAVQLISQLFLKSGDENDVLRFGPRIAFHNIEFFDYLLSALNAKYYLGIHPLQLDHPSGFQWQMEHVFYIKVLPTLLDNRVYIGGFADHNFDHGNGPRQDWVEEAQLGVRVYDRFYAAIEQRWNGYRKGNESSLGLGIEYLYKF